MKFYPNLTSLKSGMKTNEVRFLDNDQTLPYVLGQDGLYHYFAQWTTDIDEDDNEAYKHPSFALVMTSSHDLQTEKESK